MASVRADRPPIVLLVFSSREEGELARLVFERDWPIAAPRVVEDPGGLAEVMATADWAAVVVDADARWAGGSRLVGVLERLRPEAPVLVIGEDIGAGGVPVPRLPRGAATLLRLPEIVRTRLYPPATRESTPGDGPFRSLLEQSSLAVFAAKADGRLISCNDTFRRLTGLPPDEKSLPNLMELGARAGDWSRMLDGLEPGERDEEDAFLLRGRDGVLHTVRLWVRRAEDGTLSGVVEDRTEAERAQTNLERLVERLRAEHAELEHLTSFASHELQEPLRTVERYTKMLAEKPSETLNGSAKLYAELVLQGTERMQSLVDDLLRYSRAMRAEPQIDVVDANRALASALAGLHGSIAESGAEIVRGELPEVEADEAQLTTVFQNLIANAIKYRSNRPPCIEVEASQAGDGWTFRVKDNGIGIAPQDQTRIFKPFERLHSKDEIPGTGLGLALCRRIVERHGGELRVDSQPGAGSTFTFSLPATETCHALS